jgi:hypothetical protein
MRRNATEYIRELENRIANLEKSARPINVVDAVIPSIAYLHLFSSSYAIVDVPSNKAALAEASLMSDNVDYDFTKQKAGRWVQFTITSKEWLQAHSALTALRGAGFKIVASEKTS